MSLSKFFSNPNATDLGVRSRRPPQKISYSTRNSKEEKETTPAPKKLTRSSSRQIKESSDEDVNVFYFFQC